MLSEHTLRLLLWGQIAVAVITFPTLFLVPAPYGRYKRPGWGPSIPVRTAWICMEAPAALMLLYSFVVSLPDAGPTFRGVFLLGLFLAHYFQRTVIFPLRMRDSGEGKPVATTAMGALFNVVNGMLNGVALAREELLTVGHAQFLLGVALFVTGFAINLHADAVLRSLRRPGETGYKIPNGGAFRWVSAANYFGEIVEWMGFAVAAGTSASIAFVVFTMANLVPRGWAHHQFYLRRFPDYPKDRRAVIPYLF